MSDELDIEARLDALERLLGLLAAHVGVDLDQLAILDRVERRGYAVEWGEFEALGINPPRHP